MLISHQWLRELSGTKLDPREIRERLTGVGLAIDAVEERGGDSVLDVEVPSNRPDCLSHIGVARELSVIEESKLRIPESKVARTQDQMANFASVEIRDPDLCPRYAARIVRGVKIAPSPAWLAQRLEVLGQRPINNVADVTNYVLHELGQPLHAFDLARLANRQIVVRRAAPGEELTTLDGVTRKLDGEMLIIADSIQPVGVGGVMGGEYSEISNATTDVLIESAYFSPASVRRTARMLGLHTEASHRFERGADIGGALRAQARCVSLICELAGGVATEDALDVYPAPKPGRIATLRPERLRALTGLQVDEKEMLRILAALGFLLEGQPNQVDTSAKYTFEVPSWRHDVAIEEDLVEEVARHTGYEKIRTELPPSSLAGEYNEIEWRKRALRRALASSGYDEAISFSFIAPAQSDQFELIPGFDNCDDHAVTLANPIIETWTLMRPMLLPGLLEAVRHNFNHGKRDVCLFELGRVFFAKRKGELPEEREAFSLIGTGGVIAAGLAMPASELDFYDLKGALETAIDAISLPPLTFEAATIRHLRPGQAATVKLAGKQVGSIGRLADAIAAPYKFRQPVFVAELDLTTLFESDELPVLYRPLPRFPGVLRDVSLLVDRTVTVGELLRAIAAQPAVIWHGASLVGTYEGEGIPETKRSVTLRLEYRAVDRTLRDEEVDAFHASIVGELRQEFAAEIR